MMDHYRQEKNAHSDRYTPKFAVAHERDIDKTMEAIVAANGIIVSVRLTELRKTTFGGNLVAGIEYLEKKINGGRYIGSINKR